MLKWLVIGIGDITTKRVIPALLEEKRSELWGIVTRDPAKAAPYRARVFTDLEEALAAGEADAVYVASPVFLHAPQTRASLGAGKQVLCEKPMAMNYAEARSMVEAARAAGKDKLTVIGVDGNSNAVKSIVAGRLNASVAQLPYLVGMQAVENAKKVLAGEKVPEFTYVPTLVLTKAVLEEKKEPMLQYVK